jgi:hypothetical protein
MGHVPSTNVSIHCRQSVKAMGKTRNKYKNLIGILQEREHSEDPTTNGKVIFTLLHPPSLLFTYSDHLL